MEATQGTLPQSPRFPGLLQCGPVRQPSEPPTAQVHQLEAGPRSDGHRRLSEELEEPEEICVPTLCTDRQIPSEDKGRTEHSSTDSSHLAEPAMVSGLVGDVDRGSTSPPVAQGHVGRPRGPATSTSKPKQTKTSRLEDIWRQHASAGVSRQTSELLLAGWSSDSCWIDNWS